MSSDFSENSSENTVESTVESTSENTSENTAEGSVESADLLSQTSFYDVFRFLLGWRNAAGYVVSPDQRRKASPAGSVHVPTAVCALVQI